MHEQESTFEAIKGAMIASHEGVFEGRMMRSPAITVHEKVFAFLSRKGKMVFKLGDDFIPEDHDIRPFNPFKTKGPLRGWYEVDLTTEGRWKEFAERSMKIVRDEQ